MSVYTHSTYGFHFYNYGLYLYSSEVSEIRNIEEDEDEDGIYFLNYWTIALVKFVNGSLENLMTHNLKKCIAIEVLW